MYQFQMPKNTLVCKVSYSYLMNWPEKIVAKFSVRPWKFCCPLWLVRQWEFITSLGIFFTSFDL